MLMEIALGDAYGAAFEFTHSPKIPNDLSRLGPHPKSGEIGFTDDTLRSVANTMVILYGDASSMFRPESYLGAIMRVYNVDRRQGWSTAFQTMLETHAGGDPQTFLQALRRRATNGCIMGVAPLGHLPDPEQVKLAATMQTVSTHSGAAAPYVQVVALAAHHMLHGGTSETAVDFAIANAEWLDEGQAARFRRLLDDTPPVPAMPVETIAAGALWALSTFGSQTDALKWACSRGGDSDSLAAVTMALASCAKDIVADIPEGLRSQLDTRMGSTTLMALDAELREKYIK